MSLHRTTTAGSLCRDGLPPLDIDTASDVAINNRIGAGLDDDRIFDRIMGDLHLTDPTDDYRGQRLDGEEVGSH